MDRFTIRNLELIQPAFPTGKALIDVIDTTISPMGSRLMRKWMLLPLKSLNLVQARHEMVALFIEKEDLRTDLVSEIKLIGDLERLVSKVSMGKVNPREIRQLLRALESIEPVRANLLKCGLDALEELSETLNPCGSLVAKIQSGKL